jgi:hypothetical protein
MRRPCVSGSLGNRNGKAHCIRGSTTTTQVQNCILAKSAQSRNSIPIVPSLSQVIHTLTIMTQIPDRFAYPSISQSQRISLPKTRPSHGLIGKVPSLRAKIDLPLWANTVASVQGRYQFFQSSRTFLLISFTLQQMPRLLHSKRDSGCPNLLPNDTLVECVNL